MSPVKKVGGGRKLQFSKEEIIGAENFNFAPKFPQNGISDPFLGKNYMTRRKFSDRQKFRGRFPSLLSTFMQAYDCQPQALPSPNHKRMIIPIHVVKPNHKSCFKPHLKNNKKPVALRPLNKSQWCHIVTVPMTNLLPNLSKSVVYIQRI